MPANLIYFAILVVISIASAYYQKQAMEKMLDDLDDDIDSGTQIKSNTRGTTANLKIIYGTHRVGANNDYVSTTGDHNYHLYYSHSLCEGPIEGIQNDGNGNPYIWFDGDRIYEKYDEYYEYDEKTGTSTQIQDTLINTAIPEFTDPMRYTAYVAWHLEYNEDLFRGIPEINYLIKGMLLYNFITTVTEWSDSPVLALYDYMTNDRYGMGISTANFDLDSWEESYDYAVSKNFKINMAVNVGESNVWATVVNIMVLFRGALNYWDGKYYLRFKDLNEEASQMTIEDEHIYQGSDGKAMVTLSDPGYYDIAKGIKVTYINPDDNLYVQDTFVIGEETGVLSTFKVIGCTDREMAGKLALSQLERSQLSRTIAGRFRDDCLYLEPNDIITFNSSSLNISDQVMRVLTAVYSNTGFIDLTLQYENIDIYNDVYDITPEDSYNTTLPDPTVESLIEDASITEVLYTQRLRTFSKLQIEFNIPVDSWFKNCEVLVSTNGDVEANYKHQLTVTNSFDLDPVDEGTIYYIILRTVNIWGTKQDLNKATKLNKLIIGKSDTSPDSLTFLNATAGDGSVSIRSYKLSDPDIEIYEFRVGDQWTGGVFLSAKRSPHEELSLVKPGSYTFWCNTKGTNDLYGENPQDTSVEVYIAYGWSSYTTFVDDYTDSTSGQIFDNVEYIEYSGDDYLKCSHDTNSSYIDTTAGINYLMGHYVSEEFDTGVAADTYYMYIDTEFITVGAGTTWGDLFTDSTSDTWAEVDADRSWKNMFEIDEAPQVNIRLWYKAESGHDWNYVENAQILAGVVTGRYFKVEIYIIDPSININVYVKSYTLKIYN